MNSSSSIIRFLHYCKSAFYYGSVTALCIFLFTQSTQCFLKYLKSPSYISTDIKDQYKVDLPAVTVCPLNDIYKSDVLMKHGISSVEEYQTIKWNSNQTNVSPQELFDQITYPVNYKIKINFLLRIIYE